ncbi:MAG: sugar phosphate nucleotidyltransferase [Flavobacteriaceae bacterium]
MKIIVPMAGRGSRLRPHTLTVPKPLMPVAGTPIVHRLVKDIAKVLNQPIDEVAFVIGDPAFFGDEVVQSLTELAASLNAKASIYRQDQPLGTGHAIMCAESSLQGPAVIAYADTLIRASFELDPDADSVIWVKQVEQPEAYGVVELNDQQEIVSLVEKPTAFVSDLAVIGIYYFKEIERLKESLAKVIEQKIAHSGEYQINDGIKMMMADGKRFVPGKVSDWMDCGNKQVTVETNAKMLDYLSQEGEELIASDLRVENAKIIPPCSVASGVELINATVGPHVSIGAGTRIENATIVNSIIQSNSVVQHCSIVDSMIGNHVHYDGNFTKLSIGDYTVIEK